LQLGSLAEDLNRFIFLLLFETIALCRWSTSHRSLDQITVAFDPHIAPWSQAMRIHTRCQSRSTGLLELVAGRARDADKFGKGAIVGAHKRVV
jgi:hypothetical protein